MRAPSSPQAPQRPKEETSLLPPPAVRPLSHWSRAGLLLGGVLLGLLLTAVALFVYVRSARDIELRRAVGAELGLPPDAFDLEPLPSGRLRILLREVVLLGEAGDTIVSAPLASLLVDRVALEEGAPVVFPRLELIDPFLRLVQLPTGEWNLTRAITLTAEGQEVATPAEEGRAVLLQEVLIRDGRVLVSTLAEGERTTRTLRDLDARLTDVRFGGAEGWRVEVAALNALLAEPDIRITQLTGWVEEAPQDGIRFALETLRTRSSDVEGAGLVRFAEDRMQMELRLQAEPLAFEDLQWLFPALPAEGQARFTVAVESLGERTAVRVSDLALTGFDSQVSGELALLIGGEAPPAFLDTRLVLAPLDLRVLELLDLEERFPYAGEVRGTLATLGPEGPEGPLQVDLVAQVAPRGRPEVGVSTVAAEGVLSLGGEEAPVRLQGLQVQLSPLRLAALAPLLPEQEERLQGLLRGAATLEGTPSELRLREGELVYEVGEAPATRLAAISGQLSLEPALSYELHAVARPLALATLTELFPALPFERASLTGPIEVIGTEERVRFSVDLGGDAGLFAASGQLFFADPLRFEVTGQVQAFQPGGLLLAETPVAGALTGSFDVAGTPEEFRFEVDLTQAEGRFALAGQLRTTGELPQLEVTGEMVDFQLGAVIGRPTLFASRLTGEMRAAGGGLQPYVFDLDLRGPEAALDVEGWYAAGEVPAYAASGVVAGLNLRALPVEVALPATSLTATFGLEGRGVTPETLRGELSLHALGSTVGGVPLDAATAQLAVREGILRVDTLVVGLRGTQLAASGTWGLTHPAPEPLRFSFSSPDLTGLSPVLVPVGRADIQLTGALEANGWVAGSLEYPAIGIAARGRNLRYDGWRAAALAIDGRAEQDIVGWSGRGNIAGSEVMLAGIETLQTVRLEVDATPAAAGFGVLVRRDAQVELAASGILEFREEQQLRGIELENLALRLGPSRWQLAAPTHLRWGGIDGIAVDSLVLRRTGPVEGFILVDGRLPPTGTADLRVQAAAVNLGDLLRLVPTAPPFEGVLTLDALIEGPVGAPELALAARLDSLQFEGAAVDSVSIRARYDQARMVANAQAWGANQQLLAAEASLPMLLSLEELTPEFEMLEAEPVSGRLVADSLPLGLVVAVVPQAREGAGLLSAAVELDGTLAGPNVAGWAAVNEGALTLPELGVRYREIDARLALEGELVRVQRFTARSGGALAVTGTVRLDDLSRPDLALSAALNEFRAISRPDVATVAATGQLTLAGRLPHPTLSGRLLVTDGNISIPAAEEREAFEITDIEIGELGADTIGGAAVEPTLVEQIRIEGLEVVIGEGVWAASEDMRVQLGGELLVSRRDIDAWQVYGDLQAQRGTYQLTIGPILREFDIVSGRIQFFGTPDLNPALDITAAHRVRDVTGAGPGSVLNVLVHLTGTVQFPRLQLTSDTRPPLPESELLSYLIFGRPTFALGAVGATFAQQIIFQEAVGSILLAPFEQWLRQAGLFDYVRVRGRPTASEIADPLGATTVEVGWQLGRDVFWTVEWGVGLLSGQSAATWGTSLEWQIDPQWSARIANEPLRRDVLFRRAITAFTDITRQWSIDLRRRWQYGYPREPEPLEPLLIPDEPAEPVVEAAPQPPNVPEDSQPDSRSP